MKKLSKNNLLLIVLGVLIVALANLSAAHSSQVNGQNQLIDELALAKVRLSKIQLDELSAQQLEKEAKLKALLFEIDAARRTLVRPIASIEVSDLLLRVADISGVRPVSMSSSGIKPEELGGIPAQALSLTVKVEGEVPGILDYITNLNAALPTGYVKLVEVVRAEEMGTNVASMVVTIYTDRGS